jgi:putative MFS transporter
MFSKAHRRLLLLLGAATVFDGYDRSIATLALPYIGRDLTASESNLGYALSVVRIGAFAAALCGTLADRVGRRRVLLATVVGYTLATVATGFSRGIGDFVAYQLVATIFLTAEVVLANVVVAEELPAELRATGIGLIGALGAIGSSLAAVLFPVMQRSDFGWRGLYLLGALPLVLIALARRSLAETQRWRSADHRHAGRVRELLRPGLRGRFLFTAFFLFSAILTESPGFSFASYRATNSFGWSPTAVSALIVSASVSGFFGWIVGGRLSDGFGRHRVAAIGLLVGGIGQLVFYLTPWLFPALPVMIFGNASAMTVIYTYATELFPTHLRATARAWIGYAGVLGGTTGLALVGFGAPRLGGAAPVLALLAGGNLLVAGLIVVYLPETRAQELEAIAALSREA